MNRPLISYYGDDFTGSTDVMEALSANGIETVLFLKQPDADMAGRFPEARAFGLAGTSRSETPEWMDRTLPGVFAWLKGLGAEICHYKICSTFDSAPHVGSIGRAIEIGRTVFGTQTVPLVVGAPQIRRYTAFGHLFAAYQGRVYRIDRHPVMSRHPVTPMAESDVLAHLAAQTALAAASIDNVALLGRPEMPEADVLLIDVDDEPTQAAAGRLLWERLKDRSPFVCGSSGIEYALIHAWRAAGLVGEKPVFSPVGPVERMVVVSGSVSPTTERQIRHALSNGFEGVALDAVRLADDEAETGRAVEAGLAILSRGASPLLYTALGPRRIAAGNCRRARARDTGSAGRSAGSTGRSSSAPV
jgi:uncharacterized protein YgbK (DUF1537 family)